MKLRDNTANKFRYRYKNILQVPRVRTIKFGKKSYSYAAAVLWNSFPDEFRKEKNFNQFKALISNLNGDDCKYNMCRLLCPRTVVCCMQIASICLCLFTFNFLVLCLNLSVC